jgi:hypothetical protein
MSEMVDRVARSLYEQDHASEQWDESYAKYFAWDGPNFKGQDYFRRIALTAIEAMRNPTKDMQKAVEADAVIQGGLDDCNQHDIPDEAWRIMIDAALGKVDA